MRKWQKMEYLVKVELVLLRDGLNLLILKLDFGQKVFDRMVALWTRKPLVAILKELQRNKKENNKLHLVILGIV